MEPCFSMFLLFDQDVDECVLGTDNCDPNFGICINTPGNFQCVCQSDLLLERTTNQCVGEFVYKQKHALGFCGGLYFSTRISF